MPLLPSRRLWLLVGGAVVLVVALAAILGAVFSLQRPSTGSTTAKDGMDRPTKRSPSTHFQGTKGEKRDNSDANSSGSDAHSTITSDPRNETFLISALAIGDWGRTVLKEGGSCCQRRKAYTAMDLNAMEYTATLLGLAAAQLQPRPAVILGHGDNFYWTGLQSLRDQAYRFQETFETKYNDPALTGIPWINVLGNHDYGGASYLCADAATDAPARCASTDELLKALQQKFMLQSSYVSPHGDRWRLPDHFYVHTLRAGNVSVEVYNLDTNDADTHGARQICCQCYGYSGGDDAKCEEVVRGHAFCAGGDTAMFDACMRQLEAWGADSRTRLVGAAANSTATWKLVNTHYSPYNHFAPAAAERWRELLTGLGIQAFFYGHTHGEKHDYASFGTHFIENGAGGGIQNESPSGIPPYAADYVEEIWAAGHYPYGIFSLRVGQDWLELRFMTFDARWVINKDLARSVTGGIDVRHCWWIPRDGGRGRRCDGSQ